MVSVLLPVVDLVVPRMATLPEVPLEVREFTFRAITWMLLQPSTGAGQEGSATVAQQ
jgi:hypothetical protein